MEFTSLVLSVISITNMAVLGILIVMFTKIYVKTKAELPIGMIIVAPCILPMIPAFLAYISGTAVSELGSKNGTVVSINRTE